MAYRGRGLMQYASRTAWRAPAGDPAPSARFRGPLNTIWVHTGAVRLNSPGNTSEERAHCRSYERTALHRGWTAVGYNVLVGQSGTAYVGRGLDKRSGANQGTHNSNALSVCVIGHGDYEALSEAAQRCLTDVIDDLMDRHGADRVRLLGHREEPTDKSCPGNRIMPWLIANRDSNRYWEADMPTAAEIATATVNRVIGTDAAGQSITVAQALGRSNWLYEQFLATGTYAAQLDRIETRVTEDPS